MKKSTPQINEKRAFGKLEFALSGQTPGEIRSNAARCRLPFNIATDAGA